MSIVESDNARAGVEAVATGEGLAREEQTREFARENCRCVERLLFTKITNCFFNLWGTLGSSPIWCFK